VGGVFHKVQAAHLKLCASRAFWLVAYPTQSHEMGCPIFCVNGVEGHC